MNSSTVMLTKKMSIINIYLSEKTKHLNVKPDVINHYQSQLQPNITDTFKNHESIQRIKLGNFESNTVFSLRNIMEEEIKKGILNFSSKKL